MEVKYSELSDLQKREVELIFSRTMSNANVPIQEHEDVTIVLGNWNPKITIMAGIVSSFTKENQKTIDSMIQDRFKILKLK